MAVRVAVVHPPLRALLVRTDGSVDAEQQTGGAPEVEVLVGGTG